MGSLAGGLMRPGSREFVIALNGVLAALFIVMLTVVYTELENSYHAFVMLFIVVGLTVSINWFIIEANKLSASDTQGSSSASAKEKSASRPKTD